MALRVFETALGKDRTVAVPDLYGRGRRRFDYNKGQYVYSGEAKREAFAHAAGRTLHAVQTVCDALIPPSAGRYTVAFGGRTASTERGRRRITVTPQPLFMKGLRLADVADTMTGFVVHEIGHVAISGATDEVVEAWLASEPGYLPWKRSVFAISNVLDDHALEVWAKRRFPGVGHTFRVTTKFVAQEQGLPNKPPRRFDPNGDYTERFNFMVVSVRYRWFVRWIANAATVAERQWWIDWADEYGDPNDAEKRLAGIKAGLARLAIKPSDRAPEEQPSPEPEQGEDEATEEAEDTFDTDTSDEDEDGDEDGDDADGDDDDDFEDDDDDDTTDGGGNDDDDTSDEDDDEPEGDGDDGEDSDQTGESEDEDEGEGASDPDEDDEDGDEGEGEGEDEASTSDHTPLDTHEDGTAEPTDDSDEQGEDEGDEPDDFDGSEDDADGDESDGTDESGKAGLTAGQDGDDLTDDDDDFEDDDEDDRQEGGDLNASEESLGNEGQGSSNAPIYEGFEPEKIDRDAVQTVDDYNEEREKVDSYRDDRLQEAVEVEMRATRITDTHGHGTMKVVINL